MHNNNYAKLNKMALREILLNGSSVVLDRVKYDGFIQIMFTINLW